jgi:hypothetical protein
MWLIDWFFDALTALLLAKLCAAKHMVQRYCCRWGKSENEAQWARGSFGRNTIEKLRFSDADEVASSGLKDMVDAETSTCMLMVIFVFFVMLASGILELTTWLASGTKTW